MSNATFELELPDYDRNVIIRLSVECSLTENGNLDTIDIVRLIGGRVTFGVRPIELRPEDDFEMLSAGGAIANEREADIREAVSQGIERRREAAGYSAAELQAEIGR